MAAGLFLRAAVFPLFAAVLIVQRLDNPAHGRLNRRPDVKLESQSTLL
jgi:hypothetical protein